MTTAPRVSRSIAERTVANPDPSIVTRRAASALIDSLACSIREYGAGCAGFSDLAALTSKLHLSRADYPITLGDHAMTVGVAGGAYGTPNEVLDHISRTADMLDASFACVANAALMLRAGYWFSRRNFGGSLRKPRSDRGDFATQFRLFVRPARIGLPADSLFGRGRGRPPAGMESKRLLRDSIAKLSRFPSDRLKLVADALELDAVSCLGDRDSLMAIHRHVPIDYPHSAALTDLAYAIDPMNPPPAQWLASRLLERALANAVAKREEAIEAAAEDAAIEAAPPVFACKEDDPDYDPEDDAEAEAKLMEGI